VETEVKWCTYGAWGKKLPTFIGQLVEQHGNTGRIRYAEKQMYPLEYWDMDYVVMHESLEDAIIYMITHNTDESVPQIKDYLPFETDGKKIDWDELRKIELEIYNKKHNGK
jgi:hypothetical protein